MGGDGSESGFTLVEVLVATIISSIILAGIAGILIVTLENYPRSAAKLTLSDNAQLLSSWLVPDVESAAGTASGIQAPPPDNSACATSTGPAGTDELRLTWSSDAVVPDRAYSADYCLIGSELIRFYVQDGQAPTQTVVSRDITSGGIVVQTGATPSIGDGPPPPTVDSVDVAVTTTALVNGTPYRFHVTASRRTPALRVFPVPPVNLANAAAPGLIHGTAVPGATVTVAIIDQANHTIGPVDVTALPDGTWTDPNIDWSGLSDGLITIDVQTTDGLDRVSSATTTTSKDTTPPTVTIVAQSPPISRQADLPLKFLLTSSEPIVDPTAAVQLQVPPNNPRNLTVGPGTPCAPAPFECFTVTVSGLDTADDRGDGPVTVSVQAGAVKDLAGNPNQAPATDTVQWDLNPPTVVVTPLPPTTTNLSPLQFLATFSKHVNGLLAPSDIVISPTVAPQNLSMPLAPAGSCPVIDECFLISFNLDPATPPSSVTVTVNANALFDPEGLGNPGPVTSPAITWSPLTITEVGPSNLATFNGLAGGTGPITVRFCSDPACTAPTTQPQFPTVTAGAWSINAFDTLGARYAKVTQVVGVVTLSATVGPFGP